MKDEIQSSLVALLLVWLNSMTDKFSLPAGSEAELVA
jgi:hypothetical protein